LLVPQSQDPFSNFAFSNLAGRARRGRYRAMPRHTAAAPPTISLISLVIAAWRALL
jgi:hypothetical protein